MLSGLEGLTGLDLSVNKIEHIEPGAFENMKGLQALYLQDNNIKVVNSSMFKGLEALESLTLSGNPVDKITNGLCNEMPVLQTLDIGGNDDGYAKHLIEPGAFSACSELQTLTLFVTGQSLALGNASSFSGLRKLVSLTMTGGPSWTSIQKGTFVELVSLRSLSIKGSWLANGIASGAFLGLGRLQLLDLSDNYIQYTTQGTFAGLNSLVEANLAGNLFRQVLPCDEAARNKWSTCLDGMNPNLQLLKLDYNYITYVSPRALVQFINPKM